MTSGPAWRSYLDDFHTQRPGITDAVLALAAGHYGNAYQWLTSGVGAGRILDLACGSGPLTTLLPGAVVTGIDLSAAELLIAAAAGLGVARADTTALPFADDSFEVVLSSMALQVLPWRSTLDQVCRVLRPGGRFIATVPSTGPLTRRDQLRYAGLLLALRVRGLHYPNDAELSELPETLAAAGFDLVRDESERFALPVAEASRLIESLYLPGAPASRVAAAQRFSRRWKGGTIGVPIRRVVAVRR